MLNEMLEYEGYKDPEGRPGINISILAQADKKKVPKLRGIHRILLILARGSLFTEHDYAKISYADGKNRERMEAVCSEVKEELAEWCRSRDFVPAEEDKEKWEGVKEKLEEKLKIWNSENGNVFSTLKGNSDTQNAVNFPQILSEAIEAGPLKEYVLMIRKNWWKGIRIETSTAYKGCEIWDEEGIPRGKANDIKNAQRTMKSICAYLLAMKEPLRKDISRNYTEMNAAALGNWLGEPKVADHQEPYRIFLEDRMPEAEGYQKLLGIFSEDRRLLQVHSAPGKTFYQMDPEFEFCYEPQIIEKDAALRMAGNKTYRDYIFYEEVCEYNKKNRKEYRLRRMESGI